MNHYLPQGVKAVAIITHMDGKNKDAAADAKVRVGQPEPSVQPA